MTLSISPAHYSHVHVSIDFGKIVAGHGNDLVSQVVLILLQDFTLMYSALRELMI